MNSYIVLYRFCITDLNSKLLLFSLFLPISIHSCLTISFPPTVSCFYIVIIFLIFSTENILICKHNSCSTTCDVVVKVVTRNGSRGQRKEGATIKRDNKSPCNHANWKAQGDLWIRACFALNVSVVYLSPSCFLFPTNHKWVRLELIWLLQPATLLKKS